MTSAASEAIDPAMLDLFRAEVDTHVPVLGEGLLKLEKDAAQPKLLEALMRAAHSIKGAARIIGLTPAVQLAHVLEDCMVAAQAGRIVLGGDAIDLLLRGADLLGRIAQEASGTAPDGMAALVVQIETLAAGQPLAPTRAVPKPVVAEPLAIAAGALDTHAAEALRQEWLRRYDRGDAHIRFDLANTAEVDAAGLALLAAIGHMAKQRAGLVLEIVQARPDVATMLRALGLDRDFRLNADGAPPTFETAPCKANA
ncbi:MAG: Hpt domain-containing protein [Planctomycetia bacterium]|nr:Hpt domain-containing protein [Planctomycetia bacterium]